MNNLLLLIVACVLASCSHYPTPYRSADGNVAFATQVGGKWMHTINADGSQAFTGDNEISFQHAAQAVTTIASAYISYLNSLAEQVTSRMLQGEITKREGARLLAEIEGLKIQAGIRGAEVFNPNIPLPIRQ